MEYKKNLFTVSHNTQNARSVSLGEKEVKYHNMKIYKNERRVIITVLIEHILSRNW